MSLLAWFPFNGDTKNYGVDDSIVFTSAATFDNNGKIGKCLTSGSYNSVIPALVDQHDISIAFWCKANSESVTGNWLNRIVVYDGGSNLRFQLCNTDSYPRFGWYNNTDFNIMTSNSAFYGSKEEYYDSWHHIAITRDSNFVTFYVDGVVVGRPPSTTNTFTGNLFFTAGSTFFLNDFRLYNNCISAKEVKEISKACIVHYNFDNPETTLTNLYSGAQYSAVNINITYNFKTDVFKDYGFDTCTKFSALSTKTDTTVKFSAYSYIFNESSAFEVNREISFSCYVYNSAVGNIRLNAERGTSWISNCQGTTSNINLDSRNKVELIYGTIKPNSSGQIIIMWYPSPNMAGQFCNPDYFLVAGMQFYEGNLFIPPEVKLSGQTSIPDVTGYKHDAIPSGDNKILFHKDAIIGCNSVSSNGSTTGCLTTFFEPGWLNFGQTFSANIWIKINKVLGSDWNTIFRYAATNWNDEQIRLCYSSTTMNMSRYADDLQTAFDLKLGTWQMITWVENGLTSKLYINGLLSATLTHTGAVDVKTGAQLSLFADNLRQAYGSDNNIADFKLFSTALTDDDILELYNTKAYVSDNGSFSTNTLIEDGFSDFNVSNKAIATAKVFNEIVVLDDGSKWLKIMHHDNKRGTNLFSFSDKDKFATEPVYHNEDCWANFNTIENYKHNDLYEFMLIQEYINGNDTTFETKRWTQTNNPATNTSAGTVTMITGSSFNGLMRCAGSTFMAHSSSGTSWWVAVGAWNNGSWNNNNAYQGIPGMNTHTAGGIFDFYIRVYDTQFQIFKNEVVSNEFCEK